MKKFSCYNKSVEWDDSEMAITHYISTVTPDRYGDVVNPGGMDDSNYRKNPVVLFGHSSSSIPIGRNLALQPDNYGVKALTKFSDTSIGRDLYKLNKEGFLNAWSIGFIPKKTRALKSSEMKGNELSGTGDETYNYIEEWELLEYSNVAIPANPDCLNLKDFESEEVRAIFNKQTIKSDTDEVYPKKGNTVMETKEVKWNEEFDAKVESISQRVAGEIVKKEIDSINKLMPGVPTEPYMSAENKENTAVKDGRNFLKGIIYNKPELVPEHYKSFLGEGSGSTGGNLVPQEWYNRIMSLVAEGGVAYRNATIFNLSRKELVIPRMDTMPGFSFVTEGAVKAVSNPTFSQVILSRKDGGFITLFSKQLLEDEAFDLMGYVTQMAGKVLMLAIDRAAFRGLTPINGLLSNGIGATISEVAGDEFTAMTYDDLIAMVSSVPSHTLRNAKWYMNRTVYGAIKKLRYSATGEYVLSPQDRKELLLEGYSIELTDACPSMGESGQDKAFIGFGDLSYMALGMRNGLTVDFSKDATVTSGESTINLWQSGLVGLNFGSSFDIKFTFPSALAVLKTQAS